MEIAMTLSEWNQTRARAGGHVCNCIGCCQVCGQCRTAPWHAGTCDEIAVLKAKIAQAVARERDRLATPSRV